MNDDKPKMKQLTITLISLPFYVPHGDNERAWRVEQVTDSILHHPGDHLRKHQVTDLCNDPRWKVIIKPMPK